MQYMHLLWCILSALLELVGFCWAIEGLRVQGNKKWSWKHAVKIHSGAIQDSVEVMMLIAEEEFTECDYELLLETNASKT